jgi:hypothetical protein
LSFEAFAVSTGVVALGEMGDKTQLLALLLVARWRQPWTIAAGILVATLANHAGAAALGTFVTRWLSPEVMRWLLGISFIAVALWMLKPDDAGDEVEGAGTGRWGVFGLTVIAFFSFRQRRIRMLDQDPESLFDNREILLGPAADRIADAVALGDSRHTEHDRPSGPRD